MKTPLVSVIMPCYNAEKHLNKSIPAILNQTYSNFELIIVDDCSTDNSVKIIKRFQKEDSRVKLICNKKNSGAAISRNKGIKIAKGKYLAVNDSDDISLPKRLMKQVSFLESHQDIFMCGSPALISYKNYKKVATRIVTGIKKAKKTFFDYNYIIHSTIMFRNGFNIFYRPKVTCADDYDFFLQAFRNNLLLDNLKIPLVEYYIGDSNISLSKNKLQSYHSMTAKYFYYEFLETGKDSYASWNPDFNDSTDSGPELTSLMFYINFIVYNAPFYTLKLLFLHFKQLSLRFILEKLFIIFMPKFLVDIFRKIKRK